MNYTIDRISDSGDPLTLVSLAEAKTWLKFNHTTVEDSLIQNLIGRVVNDMEGWLWRSLIASTYKLYAPGFDRRNCIPIRRGPVDAITSVEYYDETNTLQTWASANYFLARAVPDRVQVEYNKTLPTIYSGRPDAVIVTFTTDPNVEDKIKTRILQGVGYLFENRNNLAEHSDQLYRAICVGARRNHFI